MREKCNTIINLKPPKLVKDCRSFHGMVNFLLSFLKDLISIYETHKKERKFEWIEECQKAVENIKELLIVSISPRAMGTYWVPLKEVTTGSMKLWSKS